MLHLEPVLRVVAPLRRLRVRLRRLLRRRLLRRRVRPRVRRRRRPMGGREMLTQLLIDGINVLQKTREIQLVHVVATCNILAWVWLA